MGRHSRTVAIICRIRFWHAFIRRSFLWSALTAVRGAAPSRRGHRRTWHGQQKYHTAACRTLPRAIIAYAVELVSLPASPTHAQVRGRGDDEKDLIAPLSYRDCPCNKK